MIVSKELDRFIPHHDKRYSIDRVVVQSGDTEAVRGGEYIGIPVLAGDEVDSEARELIISSLAQGYIGFEVERSSAWHDEASEARALLIFKNGI